MPNSSLKRLLLLVQLIHGLSGSTGYGEDQKNGLSQHQQNLLPKDVGELGEKEEET